MQINSRFLILRRPLVFLRVVKLQLKQLLLQKQVVHLMDGNLLEQKQSIKQDKNILLFQIQYLVQYGY